MLWISAPTSAEWDSSAQSSTYNLTSANNFSITYGTPGSLVTGDYFTDVLSLGPDTRLENLTIGLARQADAVSTGILGIGFDTDESLATDGGGTYVNFIDAMVKQGLLATRSYSLNLDSLGADEGTVLFGAYDASRCIDDTAVLDIQPDVDGTYRKFNVIWSSLTLTYSGDTTVVGDADALTLPALLDSGTSLTWIPAALLNEVASYYGVVNDPDYGYLFDCNLASDTDSLNFQFGGDDGPVIFVPMSEMAIPLKNAEGHPVTWSEEDGTPACVFGLMPTSPDDPIILGDTFLRSAYVVYDLDARQVGMCNADWSGTAGSDLVTISPPASSSTDAGFILSVTVIDATTTVTQTATGELQAPGATAATISGSVVSASTVPRSTITGAKTSETGIVNHNATGTGGARHTGSTTASGSGTSAATSQSTASSSAQHLGASIVKNAAGLGIVLVATIVGLCLLV